VEDAPPPSRNKEVTSLTFESQRKSNLLLLIPLQTCQQPSKERLSLSFVLLLLNGSLLLQNG